MSKLEYVRRQTAHLLDRVLLVFDKALRMVPADQLAFRPTPVSMSARELGVHTYQAIYVLTRAAATGTFRRADLAMLPIAAESVESVEDILAYGRQVKEYVRGAVAAGSRANTSARSASRMPAPQEVVVQPQRPGFLGLSASEQLPSCGVATCGRADCFSRSSICNSVSLGLTASISDATPAAIGAAKLVPLAAA